MRLITILLLSLAIMGCSDGVFDTPTTNSLIVPDHNYEIDTWGSNSEIYEFTPKSRSDYTCVMFMLDSGKAMGLQCFPKQ